MEIKNIKQVWYKLSIAYENKIEENIFIITYFQPFCFGPIICIFKTLEIMTYFRILFFDSLDLIVDSIIGNNIDNIIANINDNNIITKNLDKLCQLESSCAQRYYLNTNSNYWKQKYWRFVGEGTPNHSYMEDYRAHRLFLSQHIMKNSIYDVEWVNTKLDVPTLKLIIEIIDMHIGKNQYGTPEESINRQKNWIDFRRQLLISLSHEDPIEPMEPFGSFLEKNISLMKFLFFSLLDNKAYNYILVLTNKGLMPKDMMNEIKERFREMGGQDLVRRFMFARLGKL